MHPAGENKPDGDHDSREVLRPRTFFGGRLVFRDGSFSFACVIRELSETGARIELPASRLVPQRLYLLSSKKQIAYDAEIIWRKGTAAGLKFHATVDLTKSADPQFQFLRRLSAELCARPASVLSGD